MDWQIRDATLDDVYSIAKRLRYGDQDELQALHGGLVPPLAVIAASRVSSDICRVGGIGGLPLVIHGVAPMPGVPGVGVPWMLGTHEVETRALARLALRHCASEVQEMNELYPLLVNYVDDRNTLSKRWLKWLGFSFISRRPHGIEQRPFIEFVRMQHV